MVVMRADGQLVFTARVWTREKTALHDRLVKIVADSGAYIGCLNEHNLTEAETLLKDYRLRGREIINKANTDSRAISPAAELLPGLGSDLITRVKPSGKNKGKTAIKNSH